MPAACIAFPVLPGQQDALRKLCAIQAGERRQELDASEKRMGASKEIWFLQHTPTGDLWLIYFEARDPMKALQVFGSSQDPFDLWVKDGVKATTGLDLSKPPPALPELLGSYGY